MARPYKPAALARLEAQVDSGAPNRSTVSDGWLGDPAHAARVSEHNPDSDGSVDALDLTHDPAHGFDSWAFGDALIADPDWRLQRVISNGRIWSRGIDSAGRWRRYGGSNRHDRHIHIETTDTGQDDGSVWVSVERFFGRLSTVEPEGVAGEMLFLAIYKSKVYITDMVKLTHVRTPSALRGAQSLLRLRSLVDPTQSTSVLQVKEGTDLGALFESLLAGGN